MPLRGGPRPASADRGGRRRSRCRRRTRTRTPAKPPGRGARTHPCRPCSAAPRRLPAAHRPAAARGSPPTHRRRARCGPSDRGHFLHDAAVFDQPHIPPGSGPRRRDRPVARPDRRRRRESCGCGSACAAARPCRRPPASAALVDLTPSARTRATTSVRRRGVLATCRRKRCGPVPRQDLQLGLLAADADRVHQEQHVDRRPAGRAARRPARRVGTGDGSRSTSRRATRRPRFAAGRSARTVEARLCRQPCPRRGVEQPVQRPGNPLDVVRRHEQAGRLVPDDLGDAADIAGDDRDAARHRLDDRVGEPSASDGWQTTSLAARSDGTSSTWPRSVTRSPSPR